MRSYCLAQGTIFNILLITYKGKESEKEYIHTYIYSWIYIYIHLHIYIAESLCHIHESTISSVQLLSHVWLSATSWTAERQPSLFVTSSQSLLKFMSIESVIPSNHLILCHPLLLLPSIFPSIRVFSSESVLRIRWPKYWSFSSASLIFRTDFL